jgi:hypothetical protein
VGEQEHSRKAHKEQQPKDPGPAVQIVPC